MNVSVVFDITSPIHTFFFFVLFVHSTVCTSFLQIRTWYKATALAPLKPQLQWQCLRSVRFASAFLFWAKIASIISKSFYPYSIQALDRVSNWSVRLIYANSFSSQIYVMKLLETRTSWTWGTYDAHSSEAPAYTPFSLVSSSSISPLLFRPWTFLIIISDLFD